MVLLVPAHETCCSLEAKLNRLPTTRFAIVDTEAPQGSSWRVQAQQERKAETSTGMSVTWLGSSSGAPTRQRNVSCIALDMGNSGVLIVDCGEGSKRQLARYRQQGERIRSRLLGLFFISLGVVLSHQLASYS